MGLQLLDCKPAVKRGLGVRRLTPAANARIGARPPVRLRWCAVSVAALGVFVLFFNLSNYRTFASHEALVAVTAREMLATGDWIVPQYGGLPRLQKPPLAYWAVAAISYLSGDVTHWTARLPQAVSALLLAAVVAEWARRWYGPLAALGAACVQLTSVWVIIFGRRAEVDMLLCLLTTSAMALVALAPSAESWWKGFPRWLAFYGLLALAALAKFHYGPAMVAAPILVHFALQGRFRSLLHLLNPAGLAVFAAAMCVWPMLLVERVPGAVRVWSHETVGRAVGALGHDPFWFYAPHLLWLTLPWLPFAVAAMPASWKRAWGAPGRAFLQKFGRRRGSNQTPPPNRLRVGLVQGLVEPFRAGHRREQFLWVWLLVQVAIVTLSANKHKHYLAAVLPVFSLLAGQSIARVTERARCNQPLLNAFWAMFWSFGLIGGGIATYCVLSRNTPVETATAMMVGSLLALGGPLATFLFYARRWKAAILATVIIFLTTYSAVMQWGVPVQDGRLPIADFARHARTSLPPEETIYAYGLRLHAVVYYLHSPVQRVELASALAERLAAEGDLYIVTDEPHAETLHHLGRAQRLGTSAALHGEPKLVLAKLSAPDAGPTAN